MIVINDYALKLVCESDLEHPVSSNYCRLLQGEHAEEILVTLPGRNSATVRQVE